jgi:hypothetical protein
MDQNDNRVLSRRQARVIAAEEMIYVNAGYNGPPHTNTVCTCDLRVALAGGNGCDGDIGEC